MWLQNDDAPDASTGLISLRAAADRPPGVLLLQSPYDLDDLRAATGGQRAGAPRPAAGIEQVCAGGQRLFRQIERILQINALRLITNEVVEAARENRVVGLH